jgi:hypothetical protein
MAVVEDSTNTTTEVVKTFHQVFDAFDAIEGMARAMLAGNDDHIPLAKGINYIANDMLAVVDTFREQLERQEVEA